MLTFEVYLDYILHWQCKTHLSNWGAQKRLERADHWGTPYFPGNSYLFISNLPAWPVPTWFSSNYATLTLMLGVASPELFVPFQTLVFFVFLEPRLARVLLLQGKQQKGPERVHSWCDNVGLLWKHLRNFRLICGPQTEVNVSRRHFRSDLLS